MVRTSRSNLRQGFRVAGAVGGDQLDGAGALQQLVLGQVDHAHAAGADPALEPVLVELAGFKSLDAKGVDDVGGVDRHAGADRQHQDVLADDLEASVRARRTGRPRGGGASAPAG